jgi:hypothetical protein
MLQKNLVNCLEALVRSSGKCCTEYCVLVPWRNRRWSSFNYVRPIIALPVPTLASLSILTAQ